VICDMIIRWREREEKYPYFHKLNSEIRREES